MAATVPLRTTHDRPVVELVAEASGREVAVRALVDTGGGALVVRRSLAERLDLAVGLDVEHGARSLTTAEPPTLRAGEEIVDTDGVATFVVDDDDVIGIEGEGADVVLPAAALRRHHVVLDYVAQQLTVADPGEVEPRGMRVPAGVHPETGFVRVEVRVSGEPVGLLLDTGPSCCLVADRLFQAWRLDHAGWPVSAASVGPGNMAGIDFEARTPMIRAASVEWGPFTVPDVAFVHRPDSAFEQSVDPGTTAPVAGALAGNVLKHFRVEIDYGRGDVWLEQRRPPGGPDADMVGVVLLLGDGGYRVGASVTGLDDVRVGDEVLAVEGTSVDGLTLGQVIDRLRGEPGERRRLRLRRAPGGDDAGREVDVDAPVVRVL